MLFDQKIIRWAYSRAEAKRARDIWKKLTYHKKIYEHKHVYESKYQSDQDYSEKETDVKAIAFYLPQFHVFKENNEWWGEGFTEWTNTKKCTARFSEHYQPRTPHADIGYYDLSYPKTMQNQIELAKRHKIYGFCFYYYWFSGKNLMHRPLEMFLSHPEWNIHFCMCWANENFTRTWDGANQKILMKQQYRKQDPGLFISGLKKYMQDPRYIRAEGKPVLLIYNMGSIPHVKRTIGKWRMEAKRQGIGEIQIWMCRTYNHTARTLGIEAWIDGEVEFPPHNMWWPILKKKHAVKSANIFSYARLVHIQTVKIKNRAKLKKPVYHTCMMGWDNACRRKEDWTVYDEYSLRMFGKWVRAIVRKTEKKKGEKIFFINAWNEWGEGTYLEPDEMYGYANINMLSEMICTDNCPVRIIKGDKKK